MNLRNLLLCTALTLPFTACSKSPDAMMDTMVSMMEELGNAVDSANGDCGKMADGVQAVANKYEGDMKDMKAAADKMKGDKEQAAKLMKKYGDRMQKVMPKMMGMMKCADDPKMKAVNDKLKGLM
jgi:hypothetical protein